MMAGAPRLAAGAGTGCRVLAIGLDSVDPHRLRRACDDGVMPNLAKFAAKAVTGTLHAPPGMADDALWASFSTGMPVARHGRYHYLTAVPGSYDLRRFRRDDFDLPPFWETLSLAGQHVAVIDVPKSPRATALNGIEVCDWRVHGRDGNTVSSPPGVAGDLQERFGPDMTDRANSGEYLCSSTALPTALEHEFIRRLQESIDHKTTFASELLGSRRWDLFLTVYKEGHCAGHQLHASDGRLETVYRSLDSALGQLMAAAGDAAAVIVFSTSGMRPNHSGGHLLDAVLRRLEQHFAGRLNALISRTDQLYHAMRRRLGMTSAATRHRSRLAYPLPFNEIAGAIRINLVGRECRGRVHPGGEREQLLEFLETELATLKHPADGRPIVDQVLRAEDAFPDHAGNAMPDLLAIWSRSRPIDGAESPIIGTVRARPPSMRSGNHAGGGVYFAAGPTIRGERLGSDGSLEDMGATMAALLGVQLPGGGRDLLTGESGAGESSGINDRKVSPPAAHTAAAPAAGRSGRCRPPA